jgi:glycerol-3-phosphate acyltransferase PlsY
MDGLAATLLIVGSYFLGAIPTAYWMARAIKKIDIREYGSGNVGVSNFAQHVGKKWAVLVVLFDVVVKGSLPVLLASSKVLDLGLPVEVAAGFVTLAGHNWSVFIRFSGGRAMGTVLGVAGALDFVLVWAYILTSFFVWLAIRRSDSAVSWGIAAVMMPVYSLLLGLPVEVTLFAAGFLLMVIVKRSISNDPTYWTDVKDSRSFVRLLATRIVFDRDTLAKEGWVKRGPGRQPPPEIGDTPARQT